MYERIMQIIAEVISHMQQGGSPSGLQLKELESKGYTVAEISTALSWIADRIEASIIDVVDPGESSKNTHRILNDAEKEMFASDAWGMLVHYQNIGLLSPEHIEQIIERAAMMHFRKVDTHSLTMLIVSILFQEDDSKHSLHRILLSGDEQIH